MASWLRKLIQPKRPPDFLIGPSQEDPYMERWWIIPRNKLFNIYLHHMIHDDDDRAAHDHPWASLSLCLEGCIEEHELILPTRGAEPPVWAINHIHRGQWIYRGPEYSHILKFPKGPAWTLFITGPNIRTWGFHCPRGWIEWKEFVSKTDRGSVGKGCGEE